MSESKREVHTRNGLMSINEKGSRIPRNQEPRWVMVRVGQRAERREYEPEKKVCLLNQGKVTLDVLLSVVLWKDF